MVEWYWHIHHSSLFGILQRPIEERIAYIKAHKSKRQQKVRLSLIKPVKGKLPTMLVKAGETYLKSAEADRIAWQNYLNTHASKKVRDIHDKAQQKLRDDWTAYQEARKSCNDEVEALHRKECPDCPWDGKTIFPRKVKA